MNKCSLVISTGSVLKSFEMVILGSKVGNDNFVVSNSLVKLRRVDISRRRSASLVDPVNNFVFGSSSVVFRGFSVHEPFKSRVTLNSILLGKI